MTARVWRPDGPGSFKTPSGVAAVRDRTGRVWRRDRARWTAGGAPYLRWRVLVAEHGPLTEDTARPGDT